MKAARAWSGLRYRTWEPALRYCGQRNELRAHWSREREAQVVEAMRARVAMRGAGADCPVVAVKPGNAGGAKGAGRPGSLDGQRDPSVPTRAGSWTGGASRSVHAAGISELLPSASTKISSSRPCRRIQPITPSDWPSNA